MKKTLLFLTASFTYVIGYSQTIFTDNNIEYTVIPSTTNVKVSGYNTTGGVVNIPATITNNSTNYNVTVIGESAFLNKFITGVTIPDGIVSIEYQAFRGNNLTSVTIPGSVNTIGSSAFTTNLLLTSATIEEGVVTISNSAFFYCGLTSIVIPNTVTSIGHQAFDDNDLTSVTLGNNLESIAYGAFRNNEITTLTLPSSVTTIGALAFQNNLLTDVYSLSTTPPTIVTSATSDTFDTRSNIHLHIPASTMGAYVTDPGALWTSFNPVTENAALSVSDFELANDIKIISNSDSIKIFNANSIHLKNYTVYSISGTKVATGPENEIPTSFLSSGIYVLKLEFDRGVMTKKVQIN
ncbi:leucine-rich repeat domain-containing protein [Algibacter pacificus]|uniref:leucine-rich repeat domain-containing protein n=1 Tax=Algibacter pacificus TaxID=2599389 RepID=UPI0011C8A3BE|nr:leucine-rich repeat domain-containing protein [Algibacter pacificus]